MHVCGCEVDLGWAWHVEKYLKHLFNDSAQEFLKFCSLSSWLTLLVISWINSATRAPKPLIECIPKNHAILTSVIMQWIQKKVPIFFTHFARAKRKFIISKNALLGKLVSGQMKHFRKHSKYYHDNKKKKPAAQVWFRRLNYCTERACGSCTLFCAAAVFFKPFDMFYLAKLYRYRNAIVMPNRCSIQAHVMFLAHQQNCCTNDAPAILAYID